MSKPKSISCSSANVGLFWLLRLFIFCTFIALPCFNAVAQQPVRSSRADTTGIEPIKATQTADTSNVAPPVKKTVLDDKVEYDAKDSLYFDIAKNKVFLFGNAVIKYQQIKLDAAYVAIDFTTKTLFASGLPDSTGKIIGTPVFSEGARSIRSKTMSYNFETKRGIISEVITEEGEGFLHGRIVKRMENEITNVKDGSYTTCNLDHPHFEFKYQKAKVIPNNKIVTGPVYLTIADVPLPLIVPFGLFPNKKGQKSGILPPSWGESADRGFRLENGGYYWGISDFFELYIRGDIYTRGSWALKPSFGYIKRYKYNGTFNFSVARNIIGVEGTPGYEDNKDFSIRWQHNQDAKAHPTSRFSANVNIVTSKFNRYNPVSANNYLSNTFSSGISYQTSFADKYFLNVGLSHSQNTLLRSVTLTTPDISFNVNRFYPFRRKNRVGAMRWYENISVNYSMNAQNQITTPDSMLFKHESLNKFRNGVRHTIPINSTLNVLKFFNVTNSVNFNERWYIQRIDQSWNGKKIKFDTISGFKAVRDFDFRSSISTTLYGLLQFKRGPVRAVRHVIYPSVSFSIRPDFGDKRWGYWGEVQKDSLGRMQRYSYYQSSLYGTAPDGRSGNFSFSLSNNLEAKVRSKKDTITGTRKVKIFDNLSINTSYDIARDSLRWSGVYVSGRTTLFNNLQVQYNGSWNPYATDSAGNLINKFFWETDRKILRRENTTWNFSMNYSLNPSTFGNPKPTAAGRPPASQSGSEAEMQEVLMYPEKFINWNQPWNFSFSYSLRIANQYSFVRKKFEYSTVQTLSFNGDINLTPKWKVVFNSGYDFMSHKISYTNLSIYRDLHCWEMRFNWIPIGGMKSWEFQINAKSSLLQDLKLTRKKDFRDNY